MEFILVMIFFDCLFETVLPHWLLQISFVCCFMRCVFAASITDLLPPLAVITSFASVFLVCDAFVQGLFSLYVDIFEVLFPLVSLF